MRKKAVSISEVKDSISELKGKLIDISIDKGRKRIVSCVGEVIDTFPSVFTMRVEGDENNLLSCSYSDIICGTVSIKKK